jgi:hypothetical protein
VNHKPVITHNKARFQTQIEHDSKKLRTIISNELLKDSNYYARMDSGAMINSSLLASRPEEGMLVWNTPYAKRAYYVGVPSRDRNPNASLMWAEKAAVENKEKYEKIGQSALGGDG